ncbi:MAG: nucleotidyltransferase, partial [Bacteroidia bacterium]|nr:nucleotidyltransferase [Bacteroidia bacterium]
IIIIRNKIIPHFESRYNNKFPQHVTFEFVTQDAQNIPKPYTTNREKPWGTGHALLILKPFVQNKFALINADDLYGKEAFKLMHDALYKKKSDKNFFIGYHLGNTVTVNGAVSRGECFLNKNNFLTNIKERAAISKLENGLIVYRDANGNQVSLNPDTFVSMNFWGFSPDVFNVAERLFKKFLRKFNNDQHEEFLLPHLVDHMIKNDIKDFKMLETKSHWMGITYKKDLKLVSSKLKKLTSEGVYPESLW